MEKIKRIILVLLVLCIGCVGENTVVLSGTFKAEGSKSGPEMMKASLIIDVEKERFIFSYDSLSSYLSEGSYVIDEDVLTAKTSDGRFVYLFNVIDSETLVFVEEGSTDVKVIDDRFGEAIKNGMRLIKTKE